MRFSSTATFTFSLMLCLARSEDHHKRAPSGFTGVRGKKSIVEDPKGAIFFEDESDDEDGGGRGEGQQVAIPEVPYQFADRPDGDVSKRAPSMGFVGMRGKKPWAMDPRFYEEDRMPKRAPNGFFGMRGKKDDDADLSYDMEKRVHSGFFGMRGKKDEDPSEPYSFYMSEKRAPSMGFVGMRGRKSYDDTADEFEKRAPSGFFGMRGKKQWGQFALRGKKIPYQFRGKFVGVRGKKTMSNNGNFETEPNYNSDMNTLLMQLLEDEDLH
ncbi:tachykinins [Coccinella septempunctata]|uniref:tachykinins n=1 Tax=Coccinella septempunctata TaxID=41139 RepID=UPI001D07F8B9|nr:tachykinins [Coccinella septempunctata]